MRCASDLVLLNHFLRDRESKRIILYFRCKETRDVEKSKHERRESHYI